MKLIEAGKAIGPEAAGGSGLLRPNGAFEEVEDDDVHEAVARLRQQMAQALIRLPTLTFSLPKDPHLKIVRNL